MNGFDKELHLVTVATATVIINYANDIAGVWDRVVQHYRNINIAFITQIDPYFFS